jgi:hypothetical protein
MSERRARRAAQASPRVALGPSMVVLAMQLVSLWAAWPIYQDSYILVCWVLALAGGAGVAFLGHRRSWNALSLSLAGALGYFVLVIPASIPGAFRVSGVLPALLAAVTGPILSWKQLVTIELPVGSYSDLLVPFFLVTYVTTLLGLTLLWRGARWRALAVAVLVLAPLFGSAFGFSVSTPGALNHEVVTGIAALLILLVYLATSARSATVSSARQKVARRRGWAVASLVVLAAVGVALVIPQPGSTARSVLRSGIDPTVTLAPSASPLAGYRSYFTPENLNKQLLAVQTDNTSVDRVRVAVMTTFDGQSFKVGAASGTGGAAFARVASDFPPPSDSAQIATMDVRVQGYSAPWLPVPPQTQRVSFAGDRAQSLADGLFFDPASGSAVTIPSVAGGDEYTVTAYVSPATSHAITPSPSSANAAEIKDMPALAEWISLQGNVSPDEAGLAELVRRLRARGYLSHSLEVPSGDPAQSWVSALPGYPGFQPSMAGHSSGRIDALFSQLVTRQKSAPKNATDSQLVAAVGDDEQFATAVSLLAREQGYRARVALGFRLSGENLAVAPCAKGECLGRNLTAWTEVQANDGTWLALDASPQFTNGLAPDTSNRRDPSNETVVEPENARDEPPADSGVQGDDKPKGDHNNGPDLAWLWSALTTVGGVGLVVLVILSPVVAVIGTKIARRRSRRQTASAELAVAGGWDELIDVRLDHGFAPPSTATRMEYAALVSQPTVTEAALLTDEAVFAPWEPSDSHVERVWQLVSDERQRLQAEKPWWRRIAAAISLRSFTHYLRRAPKPALGSSSVSLTGTGTRFNQTRGSLSGFFAYVVQLVTPARARGSKRVSSTTTQKGVIR